MLQGYRLYDADAHAMMSPRMWETLPQEFQPRRPRPTRVHDDGDLGRWTNGWLVEGQIIPHALGPGSQPGNEPARVLEEFGATTHNPEFPLSGFDLSDPSARIRGLDFMGIDHQMLYPTTLYARMTNDPAFEAALMRSYNRYIGKQCAEAPKRLKWAGLLPLRDARQGCQAVAEMKELGASAAVVYGTAGDRLLCHSSFTPVWDELHRSGLPLCVHMGMSYPPFADVCNGLLAAHGIGMSLPAQMAFVAIVGHGMLDRYPNLKIGFLEFGAEWMLYMVPRLDHYLPIDRSQMPIKTEVPQQSIEEYAKSGRIFIAGEADDKLLPQEIELLGENQILYSSDLPHGEGRHNAAKEIIARKDITEAQKRKILYDNAVKFFGEP
ncbi:MAG TPA: amidohydrolase family protein [Candidatus Binatia bacterium]|nr:amidohydrolase family protein [Candidatus Binatia bacterium]